MKKRTLQFIISFCRLVVLSLVLLSMAVTIVVPSSSAIKQVPLRSQEKEISTQSEILPGVPAPSEGNGKFGPAKKQHASQRLVAVEPGSGKQDNQTQQYQNIETDQNIFAFQCASDVPSSRPVNTSSLISTHLGRLYTLVGARPSGTM
jgi:hypothetical protein